MIEVAEYDPRWPAWFDELRARYATTLADVPVLAIEHVGSTSVPGLAAKPIIDVDIVVAAEHVEAASTALEAIGYEPLGEMGVPQRWAFRPPPESVRTNTYVCVTGSLNLRNHLGLREVLRADPALRDEYAAVKRELATQTDDIDLYVDGKTEVIQKILERAGISEPELAELEALNRRPG